MLARYPQSALIQLALWGTFFVFLCLYTAAKWEGYAYSGLPSAVLVIVFYVGLAYANSLWLFPQYYRRSRKRLYYLLCTAILLGSVALRMPLEYWVMKAIMGPTKFYGLSWPHFLFALMSNAVALIFGAFIRIALDYAQLLQRQEKLHAQQCSAELALLKSQVQPHFLFNTLNNIYFLAHAKSERTTEAIDRLAQIMRYFTEEAPRERTSLQCEVAFLKNYIALEMLRFAHPPRLELVFPDADLKLPPMLLMPFVENLFKHGVDKTRTDNSAEIVLHLSADRLQFRVGNAWVAGELCSEKGGFGLVNLRQRLDLLYPDCYVLRCGPAADGRYESVLEITAP